MYWGHCLLVIKKVTSRTVRQSLCALSCSQQHVLILTQPDKVVLTQKSEGVGALGIVSCSYNVYTFYSMNKCAF